MNIKLNPVICFASLLVILNSCSGLVGPVDEKGFISITPKVVNSHAGRSIQFKYSLIKTPSDASLKVEWTSANSDIVEVNEEGVANIIDIGSTHIIANIFNENNKLVATDSASIYSSGKNVLAVSDGNFNTRKGNHSFSINLMDSSIIAVSTTRKGTQFGNIVYISKDLGHTWQVSESISQSWLLLGVARSLVDPKSLMINFNEPEVGSSIYVNSTGILLSQDNAKTWDMIKHPYDPEQSGEFFGIEGVMFSTKEKETIFALLKTRPDFFYRYNVYKSLDLGKTWDQLEEFELQVDTESDINFLIDPTNSDRIYVSSSAEVYYSYDGGESWDLSSDQLIKKVFCVNDEGMLFGMIENSNSSQQVAYSNDYAKTWDPIFEEPGGRIYDLDYFGNEVIAILSSDATGKKQVSISGDFGSTWKQKELSYFSFSPQTIRILSYTEEKVEMLATGGAQVWRIEARFDD